MGDLLLAHEWSTNQQCFLFLLPPGLSCSLRAETTPPNPPNYRGGGTWHRCGARPPCGPPPAHGHHPPTTASMVSPWVHKTPPSTSLVVPPMEPPPLGSFHRRGVVRVQWELSCPGMSCPAVSCPGVCGRRFYTLHLRNRYGSLPN